MVEDDAERLDEPPPDHYFVPNDIDGYRNLLRKSRKFDHARISLRKRTRPICQNPMPGRVRNAQLSQHCRRQDYLPVESGVEESILVDFNFALPI